MLSVTRLLCGTITQGDVLRYGQRQTGKAPAHLLHYAEDKKPVVVWNVTRRCNLRCVHCYSDSRDQDYEGELSTRQALKVLDDLAEFQVPTVLFSGGEPLMRPDLFDLAEAARARRLRCVLSTNGYFITPEVAEKIRQVGFSYVGVSIDGLGEAHDRFRGAPGSFERAIEGIRNCREVGMRVGLRFTLHKLNDDQLPGVLDLLETEDIPRCCVYHLAYSGRGGRIACHDLTHQETRSAVDLIFDKALDFHRRGIQKDILTVDNHTDNVYLYLRLKGEDLERAKEVYRLLRWNGGNQSGIAIADIDWLGNVHADQFSMHYSFGNVVERKFGDIWTDLSNPVLAALKDRKKHLKGRCAACQYLDLCNGNLRVRAESATGDLWAPDPACYLTDEEIGIQKAASAYQEGKE